MRLTRFELPDVPHHLISNRLTFRLGSVVGGVEGWGGWAVLVHLEGRVVVAGVGG
jgi:hypothetical protein